MIFEIVIKEYSKKWGIDDETTRTIYLILEYTNKFSRTARSLNELGFESSPRQLRYFYNKIKLSERFGKKGLNSSLLTKI